MSLSSDTLLAPEVQRANGHVDPATKHVFLGRTPTES